MHDKAISHKLIFYLHGHSLALLISTSLIDFPPSLCLFQQPRSLPSLKMQHPSPLLSPSFPSSLHLSHSALLISLPPFHSFEPCPILSISSVSHTFLYISATSLHPLNPPRCLAPHPPYSITTTSPPPTLPPFLLFSPSPLWEKLLEHCRPVSRSRKHGNAIGKPVT